MKIISFKEVGGKVEPLEKATRRKIKNLTPGHLEEELKGLKYKSERLVMSDVVVSTDIARDDSGRKRQSKGFYTSSEVVGSCHMSDENTCAAGFRQLER